MTKRQNAPAPVHQPSPVRYAIAAHACAAAEFAAVADIDDEIAAKQEGRTVTEADRALWSEKNDAEEATRQALIEAVPESVAELRLKAGYLLSVISVSTGLSEAEQADLLRTLIVHPIR